MKFRVFSCGLKMLVDINFYVYVIFKICRFYCVSTCTCHTLITVVSLCPYLGTLWAFFKQALVFMCLQYKSFENTIGEGKIALVTSNFPFSHCVFYPFWEHSAIFINFKIVVCKVFKSKICCLGKGKDNLTIPHLNFNIWIIPASTLDTKPQSTVRWVQIFGRGDVWFEFQTWPIPFWGLIIVIVWGFFLPLFIALTLIIHLIESSQWLWKNEELVKKLWEKVMNSLWQKGNFINPLPDDKISD